MAYMNGPGRSKSFDKMVSVLTKKDLPSSIYELQTQALTKINNNKAQTKKNTNQNR